MLFDKIILVTFFGHLDPSAALTRGPGEFEEKLPGPFQDFSRNSGNFRG